MPDHKYLQAGKFMANHAKHPYIHFIYVIFGVVDLVVEGIRSASGTPIVLYLSWLAVYDRKGLNFHRSKTLTLVKKNFPDLPVNGN